MKVKKLSGDRSDTSRQWWIYRSEGRCLECSTWVNEAALPFVGCFLEAYELAGVALKRKSTEPTTSHRRRECHSRGGVGAQAQNVRRVAESVERRVVAQPNHVCPPSVSRAAKRAERVVRAAQSRERRR